MGPRTARLVPRGLLVRTASIERGVQANARRLFDAFEDGRPIPGWGDGHEFTLAEAYDVQRELVSLHLQAGRRQVGWKIGLTSRALQEQLGVSEPCRGAIFASELFDDGVTLSRTDGMIAPRIEAEVGFLLGQRLEGPRLTVVNVLAATAAVFPAVELVDCRIEDWAVRPADAVADNACAYGAILGRTLTSPRDKDLSTIGVVLERDGALLATGAGAAVLEHPAQAVAWLGNSLAELGMGLETGEIILSGACTPPFEALRGRYRVRCGAELGALEFAITD